MIWVWLYSPNTGKVVGMSDLKPCPFCDGEPTQYASKNQSDNLDAVGCFVCGVDGMTVDEWNTRASDKRIEQLEKENAELKGLLKKASMLLGSAPDFSADELGESWELSDKINKVVRTAKGQQQ